MGDKNKDGSMNSDEFKALHAQAEMGDERQKYDPEELDQGFADLDKDKSASISLDEWRRPFEQHTDAWLQMADTEAQQEAQIAHYKDVFNQMDFNGTIHSPIYESLLVPVVLTRRAAPRMRQATLSWTRQSYKKRWRTFTPYERCAAASSSAAAFNAIFVDRPHPPLPSPNDGSLSPHRAAGRGDGGRRSRRPRRRRRRRRGGG